ncbi:MAG: hypothetical protein Q8O40_07035 [Chloroflexota bacterium]|nr:hypothetical protein [Chloroflexota bacterium]
MTSGDDWKKIVAALLERAKGDASAKLTYTPAFGCDLKLKPEPATFVVTDISGLSVKRTFHGLVILTVSEQSADRDMKECAFTVLPYLRGPVEGHGLRLLTISSYLSLRGDMPEYLKALDAPLASRLISHEPNRGLVDTHSECFKELGKPLIDLVEKYGLVAYHRDSIPNSRLGYCTLFAKLHFYGFVIGAKALLDQMAVFLNDMHQIGARRGDIDLTKTLFRGKLAAAWPAIAPTLDTLEPWLGEVQRYRDSIIHKRGLAIVADVPRQDHIWVTKNPDFDPYFDGTVEQFDEMNTDPPKYLKPITDLCNEWVENIDTLFEQLTNAVLERIMKYPELPPSQSDAQAKA